MCRQLYTEHKLPSLTADGQLEVDSFKVGFDQPVKHLRPNFPSFPFYFQLPSACACFVREDFMLEFRFLRQKLESEITVKAIEKKVANGM